MTSYKIILKYIRHWFKSYHPKGSGIHSPFIFNLVTQVIRKKRHTDFFKTIENERKKLLKDKRIITVQDYGAGSQILKNPEKKVSDIAKHSLKPKKQAQLLFRLINHMNSQHILELGTSLGITTSYMASALSKPGVITLEGCPQISNIAKTTFSNLKLNNIELITGEFDTIIKGVLNRIKEVDFVFFDGNHKGEATLNYFLTCLPYIGNNTIFVFDDIHMSEDMEQAWKQIKANKTVKVTIDIFYMGIVLFKKELSKQDFNVRL